MLSLVLKPWIATCGETRARLSAYLDGELEGRALVRVRRHLARCKRCRALLDALARTIEHLRSLGLPETGAAEPATVRAILERIERERGHPPRQTV